EYITTARRHGDDWFIGSVIDTRGGELTIPTDFLKRGVEYTATLYEDTPQTHCNDNPEAYAVREITIKKGDTIEAKLAPGGGHAIYITPKK
ncbi:MAG: glycoside hydrolase family 97 C-terminal domain-containing protein, partial [Rikenellaceae bacterium]